MKDIIRQLKALAELKTTIKAIPVMDSRKEMLLREYDTLMLLIKEHYKGDL